MTDDNYHSDFSAVSKTMLNLFCESRVEYHATYVAGTMRPKVSTKAMLEGTVLHSMLLEDKTLSEIVAEYPESCFKKDGTLNGKAAASFRADNAERVCMKASECHNIHRVVDSVITDERIAVMLSGATAKEQRYDANVNGLLVRCKPDILCELDEKVIVYDLKFTQMRPDPQSFRRQSKRFRMWLQDAHYSAILGANFNKPVAFRFAFIELNPPYRKQWYWYDQSSRESARAEHWKLLGSVRECYETGDWSDKWDSTVVLEPWDFQSPDDLVEVEQ